MENEFVLTELRDRVMWITINREDRRNAMNDAVRGGILQALERAADNADIRAVVLTGAGERAFCAGADLSPEAKSFEHAPSDSLLLARLLKQAKETPLPMIARVNGHCLAGGTPNQCPSTRLWRFWRHRFGSCPQRRTRWKAGALSTKSAHPCGPVAKQAREPFQHQLQTHRRPKSATIQHGCRRP